MKISMKVRITTALTMLVAKVSDYINQNETRRITVGLALSVGSALYTFFLTDLWDSNEADAFMLSLMAGKLHG